MREILLALLAITMGVPLFGQDHDRLERKKKIFTEAGKGYYIKDSVIHFAYICREEIGMMPKRVFIPAQQDHPEAIFLPEDISEFGFLSGERYYSVQLETGNGYEWFFLEELQRIDNNRSILYLLQSPSPQEMYYLLEDGTASAVATKEDPLPLWNLFSSLNDCSWDRRIRYPSTLRKGMVKRYYSAFAQCNEKMFPRTRFGVTATIGTGKPKIIDNQLTYVTDEGVSLGKASYHYDMSFSVGVFFRIPIEEVLSFQGEITYSHHSAMGRLENMPSLEVKYTANTMRLPMLFRFINNYSRKNLMPYGEIGPCFDFNFRANSMSVGLLEAYTPFFAAGASLGAGAEYYINPRRAVYFGARFSIVTKFQRDYKYNLKTFQIVVGFSL